MGDSRLERERDVLAEAAKLLKLVRTGRVTQEGLELAGCLGYPPALEALGPEAPREVRDLKRWCKRLDAFGHEACSRMIVAAARTMLPLLEAKGTAYAEAREAVKAGEQWLECPCPAHADRAQQAYTQAIAAAVHVDTDATETAALVAAFAAHAATAYVPATDIVADAADVASEEVVRRAVIKALLPWALREYNSGEGRD